MSLNVGMDIGTDGAVVTTINKGSVEVILNEASKRKSPGLVSFKEGQRYLGEPASSLESSNWKNTVRELKRLVGKQFSDPETQRDIARLPNKDRFRQLENDSVGVEVTHDGQEVVFDAKLLLAMQLAGLKRTSENSLKEAKGMTAVIRDVVLSVPPYFNDRQRRAVLDAGSIAGLNVIRLINDNAAVVLDYGMWKNARGEFDDKTVTLMFVDVGYSDSWVSIATYTKGKANILSCTWDRELGGRDVDAALMQQFADEFKGKTKLDPMADIKARIKMRKAAEKAKQVLTPEGLAKAEVFVEYLMNEIDFKSEVTVEQLEAAVAPLCKRIQPLIDRALMEAKLTAKDIQGVELVGGSCRMRQIKKAVASAMGLDATKPPNYGVLTTLNTDESVARGCTLMCALLSPNFRIATTLEVQELVPLPIKVEWEQPGNGSDNAAGGEEDEAPVQGNTLTLLRRTDETPKVRRVTFRRSEPFEIVASYDNSPEDPLKEHLISGAINKWIGSYKISGMQGVGKDSKVKIAVEFSHNRSGVFSVSGAQLQTEQEQESGEGEAKEKKKKIIKTELTVESKHTGSTDAELAELIRIEADLTAKDQALKNLADKRNELEEFTYQAKSDLEGSLAQYATPDEVSELMAKLEAELTWIDDEAWDADLATLTSRLAAVHTPYDKIQNRLLEIQARGVSAEKLSQQIQTYLTVANSVSPDHAHITEDERKKVRVACDDTLTWLTTEQENQGKLPLNQDPVLTASVIDDRAQKLRSECRSTVEKPKPKPEPKKEEAPAEGEKMDVEGEEKQDGDKMDEVNGVEVEEL